MGFLAAVTKKAQIGSSILPLYSRTPTLLAMTAVGLDKLSRGRIRPGPGRFRAPGDRGLPRRALRRPAGSHPRDHRDLPIGVAARPPRTPGRQLPGAAGRGEGHRARQGAQDHGPSRARADPHLRRLPRSEERRHDRRARGRVAAPALLAGAGPRAVAVLARGGPGGAVGRPAPARDRRRRVTRHRRRRRRLCATGTGPCSPSTYGGMGAKGKNFYNDVLRRYGYEKEADEIQDALPRRQTARRPRPSSRGVGRGDVPHRRCRLRQGPCRRRIGSRASPC